MKPPTLPVVVSLAFLFLCFSTYVECAPKVPCNETAKCDTYSEKCVDEICECQDGFNIDYNASLEPECKEATTCLPSCGKNQECINGFCQCMKNMFYFREECKIAKSSNYQGGCLYSRLEVAVCDVRENLTCINGTCICTESHYFESESQSCKPKWEYLTENNITEYKVQPNVYCRTSIDCVTGLECMNFTCKCPEPCTFLTETKACDCGDADVNLAGPATVGVILGFMITYFFVACIVYTVKDMKP